MLAPISWLKEFVEIKNSMKELMWKMTEAGLTCEAYKTIRLASSAYNKSGDEIVLDFEVTPNRPDWMSIVGIAREISAIFDTKFKEPDSKVSIPTIKNPLEIKIVPNYKIVPRVTSVIIRNVSVKASPPWMQKKLRQVGLRPINNLVDITNYVLWLYGNSLHVFDYDKIKDKRMSVEEAKGGEAFRSLDGLEYTLPKGAIIIKDKDRVIDLIPLKGGENTAVSDKTKNVLLHSIICNPIAVRRVSQTLGLRSDSSAIAERGMDPRGTIKALEHALSLILELAGGEVASEIFDHKEKEFIPWTLELGLKNLEKVLGINVPKKEVLDILTRLRLSPKLRRDRVECTVPTYRGDLKLEEDLIEEVARIHGYNKFPKTLPEGTINPTKVPYFFDDGNHILLKNLLIAAGYSEVMTLSLISGELIEKSLMRIDQHIRLTNPVSSDYEYLRVSLIPSLLLATRLNPNEDPLLLFELDKVYLGKAEKASEPYMLSTIARGEEFRKFKGVVDLVLKRLNIGATQIEVTPEPNSLWHSIKSGVITIKNEILGHFGEINPEVLANLGIKEKILGFEFNVETLLKDSKEIPFASVPQFPPQIEDITLTVLSKTKVGDVVNLILQSDKLVASVELTDIYKDSYTFRIWYQHPSKTLNDKEVERVREDLLKELKNKFGVSLKD